MLGIIIGAILSVIALLFALCISIKEIKNIKNKKFICQDCGKEFSPKGSASLLFNFGDNSKAVKCPHCGDRSRMLPRE